MFQLPEKFNLRMLLSRPVSAALLTAVLLAVLWPGLAIGLCGTAALLIYLHRKAESLGDPRLFKLFAAGLALRFIVIAFFSLLSLFQGGGPFTLFGDSLLNFDAGFKALQALDGTINYTRTALQPGVYGYSVIHWLRGLVYFVAGYSPFLVRLINVVLACLVGWMVYLITFRVTGHRVVSAWAMGFTLFWPSNFIWSVELLKEPLIQLNTAVIIYLFVDLIVRRNWRNLFLLAFLWYPLGHLREKFHYLMLGSLLISLLLFLPRRPQTGIIILLVLTLGAAVKLGSPRLKTLYEDFQYKVVSTQIGFLTTGGSYYLFIPERYEPRGNASRMTPSELGSAYLKALFYYLGMPKPYSRLSLSKLPTLPQMVLWYLMLVLFLPQGALYLLRYHYRASGVLLVFLFFAASVYAMFTGNEGTAFRHRDVLTPFIFIPVSVGMFNFRGWLALTVDRIRKRFSSALPET